MFRSWIIYQARSLSNKRQKKRPLLEQNLDTLRRVVLLRFAVRFGTMIANLQSGLYPSIANLHILIMAVYVTRSLPKFSLSR